MDPFCRVCFPWNEIDEELASFYKKLGEIRTEQAFEILKDGDYREIFADSACIVYERSKGKKRIYVWCNLSSNSYKVSLPRGIYRELISETDYRNCLTINGNSYGILMKIK